MTDDSSTDGGSDCEKVAGNGKEVLGGKTEKGFTGEGDGELGSEGDYGFIRPSAEDSTSDGSSDSDSE